MGLNAGKISPCPATRLGDFLENPMKRFAFFLSTAISIIGVALPVDAKTEFFANQFCKTTTADGKTRARMVDAALGEVVSIFIDANKRVLILERNMDGAKSYQEMKLKFIKRSGKTSYWSAFAPGSSGRAIRNDVGLAVQYAVRIGSEEESRTVASFCQY